VKAEYFILDNSCQREKVEELSKELPHIRVSVLPLALVIKSIDLRDLSGLMISSENGDSVSIPDLQCNQQGDSFYGIVSPIDIVSHEEIICIGAVSPNFE